MKIIVMNRKEVLDFCKHPHLAQFAIVSISTPHEDYEEEPFCSATNNVVDKENLDKTQFFDVFAQKTSQNLRYFSYLFGVLTIF